MLSIKKTILGWVLALVCCSAFADSFIVDVYNKDCKYQWGRNTGFTSFHIYGTNTRRYSEWADNVATMARVRFYVPKNYSIYSVYVEAAGTINWDKFILSPNGTTVICELNWLNVCYCRQV